MEQPKRRYGLFTAITMIIGICIGSGIFFKSDNILVATGGSIVAQLSRQKSKIFIMN